MPPTSQALSSTERPLLLVLSLQPQPLPVASALPLGRPAIASSCRHTSGAKAPCEGPKPARSQLGAVAAWGVGKSRGNGIGGTGLSPAWFPWSEARKLFRHLSSHEKKSGNLRPIMNLSKTNRWAWQEHYSFFTEATDAKTVVGRNCNRIPPVPLRFVAESLKTYRTARGWSSRPYPVTAFPGFGIFSYLFCLVVTPTLYGTLFC